MPSMVRSPVYLFIVFSCPATLLQRGRILLGDFRKHPHRKHCEDAEKGNCVARPGLSEMNHEGIAAGRRQKPRQRQQELDTKRHPFLLCLTHAVRRPFRTKARPEDQAWRRECSLRSSFPCVRPADGPESPGTIRG